MRLVEYEIKNGKRRYKLRHGKKELILRYDEEERNATSSVRNRILARRIKKETTMLHSCAQDTMQQIANETGKPVSYLFVSVNKKMQGWATTSGREIFNWDDEKGNAISSSFQGKKTFYPNAKTSE